LSQEVGSSVLPCQFPFHVLFVHRSSLKEKEKQPWQMKTTFPFLFNSTCFFFFFFPSMTLV
jgi:hypothetical protein